MLARALAFCLLLLSGCGASSELTDDAERPEACRSLDRAYAWTFGTVSRPFALGPVFAGWERGSRPLTEQELLALSDAERVIVDLYGRYFDPRTKRAQLRGEGYLRRILGRSTRYTVIPSALRYSVVRNVETSPFRSGTDNEVRRDTIADFRPRLGSEHRVIYLTPERREALECFLGSEHYPFGAGGIMSPAAAAGESRRRAAFLRGYITVVQGHWGGYWHLGTQPVVTYAEVNESLTEAVLFVQLGYEGGHALYRRGDDGWDLVEHRLTWIE